MFSRKQLTMKNHFSISPFLLYGFPINWQQPCLLIFACFSFLFTLIYYQVIIIFFTISLGFSFSDEVLSTWADLGKTLVYISICIIDFTVLQSSL